MPDIPGIPVLLYQLFSNIIANALKFNKPGMPPVIEISATKLSEIEAREKGLTIDLDYSVICISDNGIGFEQSDAQAIFNIYSRLNTKETYEGTGLGLALCKRIVERIIAGYTLVNSFLIEIQGLYLKQMRSCFIAFIMFYQFNRIAFGIICIFKPVWFIIGK